MKKVMFSAAILAFAGITAFSASSHSVSVNPVSVIAQDTTEKDTTTTPVPTDTTSTPTPTDTTKIK